MRGDLGAERARRFLALVVQLRIRPATAAGEPPDVVDRVGALRVDAEEPDAALGVLPATAFRRGFQPIT